VEREVTRIIPGTLTDAALLEEKRDCILLALDLHEGTLGSAWLLNLAAGDFRVMETLPHNLPNELERLKPAEILLSESFDTSFLINEVCALKRLPSWQFDTETAIRKLAEQFQTQDLSGFGCRWTISIIECCRCIT